MRFAYVLLILFTGVVMASQAGDAATQYEGPSYKELSREGKIEIREYASTIAAEVKVTGLGDRAENEAFRILAGYIFGKNKSNAKIPMTAPVTQQRSSEKIAMTAPVTTERAGDTLTMRFFMPSKYTLDTLPEPSDSRIKFVPLPPSKFAVIRFSGFSNQKNMTKHNEQLELFLSKSGMQSMSKPLQAFYDPPWTLPFMRRNEVWIEVK